MSLVKGVERKKNMVLCSFEKQKKIFKLKEEAEDRKGGNDRLSQKPKEEMRVILHKSMNLLINSILNNNNYNYKLCLINTATSIV